MPEAPGDGTLGAPGNFSGCGGRPTHMWRLTNSSVDAGRADPGHWLWRGPRRQLRFQEAPHPTREALPA